MNLAVNMEDRYGSTMVRSAWDSYQLASPDLKPRAPPAQRNLATSYSNGYFNSQSFGASFVVGLKVLARNEIDGKFYIGRICGGGNQGVFQVKFGDLLDLDDFTTVKDVDIEFIVSFDDAFHHDINIGDHVLCPMSISNTRQCYVPGTVIEGSETRTHETVASSEIIIQTIEREMVHAKAGTVVWIGEKLFERICEKNVLYKKPGRGSFYERVPVERTVKFKEPNINIGYNLEKINEYVKDELKERIDKQIHETEKLLMDLRLRKSCGDSTNLSSNDVVRVNYAKPILVHSKQPSDDVDRDSGVASEYDDDKIDRSIFKSDDFVRGRVVSRASYPPVASYMSRKPNSAKNQAKKSQYLGPEKFDDSFKATPARTEWVAKWEQRDREQKEAEEKAETARQERAAEAEKEAVKRAKALEKQEKVERKARKENKKIKAYKEKLEKLDRKIREEEMYELDRQMKVKRKARQRLRIDHSKNKVMTYPSPFVKPATANGSSKISWADTEREHIPAKEYQTVDGTPMPKSQDRRFGTSITGDANWSPVKVSSVAEVPLDIITHRPKTTFDRHSQYNAKKQPVSFNQDTRYTEEARKLAKTSDDSAMGRTAQERRDQEMETRRQKAVEKETERALRRRIAHSQRQMDHEEAERKAQDWKDKRLRALRHRKETLVSKFESGDMENQIQRNAHVEQLAKLEIEKSKEITNKMEREVAEQERRLKVLRRLRQNQLSREDTRTKRAFDERDLKSHVGDQNIQHYRASILP